jgi:methylated-DNA-[protein]-cysteine S-methyltransferase
MGEVQKAERGEEIPVVGTRWDSPWGQFVVTVAEGCLKEVCWPDSAQGPFRRLRAVREARDRIVLGAALEQLESYARGSLQAFDLPLVPARTAFLNAVREGLRAIPRGSTRTYGVLASALGRPRAARAVGRAAAANPYALVVPCHRLVASDGVGGFAGGLKMKIELLKLEGAYSGPS